MWQVGSRVPLPRDVAPGGSVTFTFSVKAPTSSGTYNFQWQMVQDGVEWFGEPTSNVSIVAEIAECFAIRAEIQGSRNQIKALDDDRVYSNQLQFPSSFFGAKSGQISRGGTMTSDAGGLLLRETDRRLKLLPRFAQCFLDGRNPERIQHTVQEMVSQRVYALALGYEDLNDHEQLRQDPVLKLLAGKEDLEQALAGKSTLNRLELSAGTPDRYKKITFWSGSSCRQISSSCAGVNAAFCTGRAPRARATPSRIARAPGPTGEA